MLLLQLSSVVYVIRESFSVFELDSLLQYGLMDYLYSHLLYIILKSFCFELPYLMLGVSTLQHLQTLLFSQACSQSFDFDFSPLPSAFGSSGFDFFQKVKQQQHSMKILVIFFVKVHCLKPEDMCHLQRSLYIPTVKFQIFLFFFSFLFCFFSLFFSSIFHLLFNLFLFGFFWFVTFTLFCCLFPFLLFCI